MAPWGNVRCCPRLRHRSEPHASTIASSAVFVATLGLFAAPPASAQQSLNFYVGGFIPRGDRQSRRDAGRCAAQQLRLPRVQHRGLQRRHLRRRVAGRVGRLLRGRPWRRVLPAHRADRYHDFVNDERLGDRAGLEAAGRAVHGDGAASCRSDAHRLRAVHRRRRRRAQLALQRERRVRRLQRRNVFRGHVRRQRHSDRARSSSAASRVPIGGLERRRRNPVPGRGGHLPAIRTSPDTKSISAGSTTCSPSTSSSELGVSGTRHP